MTQPQNPYAGVPTNQPNAEPVGWVQSDGNFPGQQLAPAVEGAIMVQMDHTFQPAVAAQYRPQLVVDGVNHPVDWGTNRVELPAGRRTLQAGVAGTQVLSPPLVVDIAPGLQLPVFFLAGSAVRHPALSLQPIPVTGRGAARRLQLGLTLGVILFSLLFVGALFWLIF